MLPPYASPYASLYASPLCFFNASGSDSSVTFTPTDDGTYDVTVTDAIGGVGTAETFVYIINAWPVVTMDISPGGPSNPGTVHFRDTVSR